MIIVRKATMEKIEEMITIITKIIIINKEDTRTVIIKIREAIVNTIKIIITIKIEIMGVIEIMIIKKIKNIKISSKINFMIINIKKDKKTEAKKSRIEGRK